MLSQEFLKTLCTDQEFSPIAERFVSNFTKISAGQQLRLGLQVVASALHALPAPLRCEVVAEMREAMTPPPVEALSGSDDDDGPEITVH